MDRRGLEFSFVWIFVILVGAVFIFLSIYAAGRFIDSERQIQNTQIGKSLGSLLNPISANIEEGKLSKISISSNSRIMNVCNSDEDAFGYQGLSVSVSEREDFSSQGITNVIKDRYVFSEEYIEGKDFIVFSKPFEMPFKIGELIYMWSAEKNYCFFDPPSQIEEELESLNVENIGFDEECQKDSVSVCFQSSGCDIDVSLGIGDEIKGNVKKKFSDFVYFEGETLLYAAIFSDSKIYECQLKRLTGRASQLSNVYNLKANLVGIKGCNTGLEDELTVYYNLTSSIKSSSDLAAVFFASEKIKEVNDGLSCNLF